MPKYAFRFDVGHRKFRALGTLAFRDDAEAIAAFAALDAEGMAAELWRPDRKRVLATKLANGTTIVVDQAKP
ncbi:hypothetical protein [Caulobacter hibisci]|uniref:Uncharacterized protein n=1 Tax=Caulobacter hibisci TaxID=2035993 RepID=A0ABS0SXV7_9CAUL|nr:hypothetical protein [Caulobacter hibisci]MBI1683467.1 hypothetical protein [Caulobacter hibisci]